MTQPAPSALSQFGEFSTFTEEDAEAEKAYSATISTGAILKLQNGRNVLRFLPARKGGRVIQKAHVHFAKKVNGISGDDLVSFNCARAMARQPCPFCDDLEALATSGAMTDAAVAKECAAKFYAFSAVIDEAHPELGPQVFRYGKSVFDALTKIRTDGEMGGDFTHPVNGFALVIEKSGSGLKTKYEVRASRKGSTPLADPSWLAVLPDLTGYVAIPTPAEVAMLLRDKGYRGPAAMVGGSASHVLPAGSSAGAGARPASSVADDD